MSYYLIRNPNPHKKQYRETRRATATGAIVVHTTESLIDTRPPDEGAEKVAAWIARRNSYGSYHDLIDSDTIVPMAPYAYEVWGVGTRSPKGERDANGERLRANSIALHLSFALQARHWGTETVPPAWERGALLNGAGVASRMSDWIHEQRGYRIPAVRITAEEFWDGQPGFISHAELDPERRYDPGRRFPWADFLAACAATGKFDNGAVNPAEVTLSPKYAANLRQIQEDLRAFGFKGELDALPGPGTMAAWAEHKAWATERARHADQLREALAAVASAIRTEMAKAVRLANEHRNELAQIAETADEARQ